MRRRKALRDGTDLLLPATDCACFHLRKATRAVTQLYDRILRPSGIKATQFTLLTGLRARPSVPISQLAERMVIERTTLTRNLEVLERDGLVRIDPGDDRRVRAVSITPKGEKIQRAALADWKKAQARIGAKLGKERLERLLADLRFVAGSPE